MYRSMDAFRENGWTVVGYDWLGIPNPVNSSRHSIALQSRDISVKCNPIWTFLIPRWPREKFREYSSIFLKPNTVFHADFEHSKNVELYHHLGDVISYVTRLSVRLCVISRNTKQFKVYERLSRRYYADISHLAVNQCAFTTLLGVRCFFWYSSCDSWSCSFSFSLSLSSAFFRIQRCNSTYVCIVYHAGYTVKWACKNAEPQG